MTYQERVAKRLCTNGGCEKKPKRGRTKCEEHLETKRQYEQGRNRAKGQKTWSEHVADVEGRRARALHRSRHSDAELEAIPRCACGIRHLPPCDLDERRRDLRTAGGRGWV